MTDKKSKSLNLNNTNDNDFFNYDSELFKSQPIQSMPEKQPEIHQNLNMNEMTLNSAREGTNKLGTSFVDRSIVSEYLTLDDSSFQ
jgi:hypothetical protein